MKIEIYGANWCKPCRDTKKFLDEKGLEYTFYDIDEEVNRDGFALKTGKQLDSVPQVLIDGEHIGGQDELLRKFN